MDIGFRVEDLGFWDYGFRGYLVRSSGHIKIIVFCGPWWDPPLF